MPKEIERKFLVKGNAWRELADGIRYRQGYLTAKEKCTVRVRIADNNAYIAVKSKNVGATRLEYEYEIPLNDADEMLKNLCKQPLIKKKRYKIPHRGLIWEIDEFEGENDGLILAEVELTGENQSISLPEWIGREVTGDPKYYNANLVKKPYKKWR